MKENLTDKELVDLYVYSQDKSSFGDIYQKYLKPVYRYVYGRVGNKEICEDIVSETFLTLIDVLKNYDEKAKLNTFITGIAINKMRQYFDKIKNQNEILLDENFMYNHKEYADGEILSNVPTVEMEDSTQIPDSSEQSQNEIEAEDIANKNSMQIRLLLKKLEPREKDILEARFLESMQVKAVAKKLNLTPENVRIIQFRALNKLKKLVFTK